MSTPKEDRDSQFYEDAYTSMTTWEPGVFKTECQEHGIAPEDGESFGQTAWRLWNCLSDDEKAEFASDCDDWLDA